MLIKCHRLTTGCPNIQPHQTHKSFSLLYRSYSDTGTISTNCIFDCDEAEQLKGKMLQIVRYCGESGEQERDYEVLFASWLAKREKQLLASEMKKKGAQSLADYFDLKKRSRQKDKV